MDSYPSHKITLPDGIGGLDYIDPESDMLIMAKRIDLLTSILTTICRGEDGLLQEYVTLLNTQPIVNQGLQEYLYV